MYCKRPDGSFHQHIAYSVPAVLPVVQKLFPATYHITERLPHHLAVMLSFAVQKLHRPFMNGSQYAGHVIPASSLLYLVGL